MQLALGENLSPAFDSGYKKSVSAISVLKRRKKHVLVTFLLVFAISSVVTVMLPSIYRSSATILIEQQEIPQEFVRSTVTTYADQRIELISQRVMTNSNLWDIIKKFKIFDGEEKVVTREELIDKFRNAIKKQMLSADVMDPRSGRPVQATIAFKLSYDDKSPVLAQKVANELTTLYLDENLKSRSELATQASNFLQEEAEKLRQQITEKEAKISEFKQNNNGILPEMMQYNIQSADRMENELSELDRQILLLTNRTAALKVDLAKLSPQTAFVSDTGERVLSPEGRLKMLESQYASYLATYSADHPDVKRTKRELDALREQVGTTSSPNDNIAEKINALEGELAAAKKKYSPEHPDVKRISQELNQLKLTAGSSQQKTTREAAKADNPAWIQISSDLRNAEDEIATLKQHKQELKSRLDDNHDRISRAPEVEKNYRELMLDYDNSIKKFQETRNKQMEAQLALSLESERKGEKLTLVEPPLRPEKPVKPNRLAIFILGFLLAASAGFSVGYIAESNDDALRGRDSVMKTFGNAPLAVIPYIEIMSEQSQSAKLKIMVAVGALFLIAALLVTIHFTIKPLDIAWFILARKLGF